MITASDEDNSAAAVLPTHKLSSTKAERSYNNNFNVYFLLDFMKEFVSVVCV